jgi:hypothetical protein
MPKREKPFHLDMSFDEALKRFAQADPKELAEPGKIKKIEREKRTPRRKPTQSANRV